MSIESMSLVLHHAPVTGTEKVILLGIANHDGDGGAWPTIATLQKYAGINERNTHRAIKRLVAAGLLRVHVQAGGDKDCPDVMRPNRYDVLVTCPAGCDRTKNHRVKELPTSPAALWINPVSPETPGVVGDTGGGVARDTQTVHINPQRNQVSASVTTGGVTPPCSTCGAPDLVTCQRRQAKLSRADRHTYTAAKR